MTTRVELNINDIIAYVVDGMARQGHKVNGRPKVEVIKSEADGPYPGGTYVGVYMQVEVEGIVKESK